MPHHDSIARLYDGFLLEGYDAIAADPAQYPLRTVLARLSAEEIPQEGASVLDLGCGSGLLKEYTRFSQYSGIDLSEDMLAVAAERRYSELIQASLEEYLPLLPDNAYDVVICFSALYFIDTEDLPTVLSHIRRIAARAWLVTLDAIPEDLKGEYLQETGIRLFNHSETAIKGETARYAVPGWKSSVTGEPVPMEVVIGKK